MPTLDAFIDDSTISEFMYEQATKVLAPYLPYMVGGMWFADHHGDVLQISYQTGYGPHEHRMLKVTLFARYHEGAFDEANIKLYSGWTEKHSIRLMDTRSYFGRGANKMLDQVLELWDGIEE